MHHMWIYKYLKVGLASIESNPRSHCSKNLERNPHLRGSSRLQCK